MGGKDWRSHPTIIGSGHQPMNLVHRVDNNCRKSLQLRVKYSLLCRRIFVAKIEGRMYFQGK